MSNVYKSEAHEYDNLLLAEFSGVATDIITIAGEQNLKRGSVIGLKADTKYGYLADATKDDGTEQPYAVLAEDVDTRGMSCAGAAAYLLAYLNAEELIVGSGVVEDYKYDMRKIGLFVRDAQRRY